MKKTIITAITSVALSFGAFATFTSTTVVTASDTQSVTAQGESLAGSNKGNIDLG